MECGGSQAREGIRNIEFSVEVKTSHARADLNHLYSLILFN